MTTFTNREVPANNTPMQRPGETTQIFKFSTLASGDAAAADVINLGTLPKGWLITGGILWINGTLGASCTMQLRIGSTAVTAASTAGGASYNGLTALKIPDLNNDQKINLLVAGATIAAVAEVWVVLKMFECAQLAE